MFLNCYPYGVTSPLINISENNIIDEIKTIDRKQNGCYKNYLNTIQVCYVETKQH